MFLFDKITRIRPGDRVLEVGPGGTPHPRSDVLLELKFDDPREAGMQRGGTPELTTRKQVVTYDGGRFPFNDREFDYVICAHVLEHVADIERFVPELFRVAPRGYVEYPTIYYEYLYNFAVHLNLLKRAGERLLYIKKALTPLPDFAAVQDLFRHSLEMGYCGIVDELAEYMFEGFEWEGSFQLTAATSLADLAFPATGLRPQSRYKRKLLSVLRRTRLLR